MNNFRFLRPALLGIGLFAAHSAVLSAATLSATGRVVPQSGIVDLFAPSGTSVDNVLVTEGQWVEAGAALATLSTTATAQQRLANAEAKLTALKKDTAADVSVAEMRVTYAEKSAAFATDRFTRMEKSKNNEFVSPDTVEERRLAQHQALTDLASARASLDRAKHDAASAVGAAEIDVAEARSALARAEVRSPLKARVLKVRTRPGSLTDGSPLFKLGDTSGIHVVAEIYETDALKVKAGQKATISSPVLAQKATGTVLSVSSMIYRESLDSLDPTKQMNAHVVEAVIKLDKAEPLDRLVLLQVEVAIEL